MCGRYFIDHSVRNRVLPLLKEKYDSATLDSWKTGETAPGSLCLTIDSLNQPALMNWKYELFGRNLINTRIESIIEKDYYREDFRLRRCLILVSGFYEWDSEKHRHYITSDTDTFYLAGIYQQKETLPGFSIITRDARITSEIHPRCPIVLNRSQASEYLNRADAKSLLKIEPLLTIR